MRSSKPAISTIGTNSGPTEWCGCQVTPALTVRFFYGWKMEECRVTNGARRSGAVLVHSTPIDMGSRPSLRLFLMKFAC